LLSFFLFIVFGYHSVINFIAVHIFPNLINLEIVRITLKAIQSQKKGAWIIALGGIIFLISVVLFVFMVYFNFIDRPLWGSVQTVGDLVYNVSWLSIPLAVAIYFGQEVAFNNSSLKEKLMEVEKLSAEKQQILFSQNETLEHQVAERTAELSTKNRELEIEAALERVRSRTMAMQKSDELAETSFLLDSQVRALGIKTRGCGFNIYGENESTEWFSSELGTMPTYKTPREHFFLSFYEAGQRGETLLLQEFSGDECVAHYDYLCSLPITGEGFRQFKASGGSFPTHQFDHVAYFKYGYLLFITLESVPEAHDIFKRFAKVFEQTYTRFLDLQKAEAQAREAQIEAALERVRSQAMSMQKSNELAGIIGLINQELGKLDTNLDRSFIMLLDENEGGATWWMANSVEPSLLHGYQIPYHDHPPHIAFLEAWEKQVTHWAYILTGIEKKEWDEFIFDHTELSQLPKFIISNMRGVETVYLSASFNKYGCISTGSFTPLAPISMDLMVRFSHMFEQTYTRFLDLQKAEAQAEQARLNLIQIQTEKKRAEDALIALKQTQAQLIQSEKLASLGELTAGIAHEIQNPLNFVNNFAEVSAELLDDMKADLQAGKTAEAAEIANDLQVNLQKINHHGQRASAIVKGMLEHSRTGDAMHRVSTDLNALADEYLRLAYHGLRAKDSSFNASMETHFDPDLPKIEVIPQDIGRVLLNLINNAFYAVHQRAVETLHAKSLPYQPTVTITTKKLENAIEITVKDNGNGIPEAIKDKIFQPFFTTKPTGQGTGLGLSLAYDIVTKGHGGKLTISSIPGAETTFEIQLPINETNLG
jgi:signal transduction histidine kinase